MVKWLVFNLRTRNYVHEKQRYQVDEVLNQLHSSREIPDLISNFLPCQENEKMEGDFFQAKFAQPVFYANCYFQKGYKGLPYKIMRHGEGTWKILGLSLGPITDCRQISVLVLSKFNLFSLKSSKSHRFSYNFRGIEVNSLGDDLLQFKNFKKTTFIIVEFVRQHFFY